MASAIFMRFPLLPHRAVAREGSQARLHGMPQIHLLTQRSAHEELNLAGLVTIKTHFFRKPARAAHIFVQLFHVDVSLPKIFTLNGRFWPIADMK
ncbi:MAG: hypothetical protein ACXWVD_19085 [Telluria sp.]